MSGRLFNNGEMVKCTSRPGNMDIYPKVVGTVMSSSIVDWIKKQRVYAIKYPVKIDNPSPLDNPIKWVMVTGVPAIYIESCCRPYEFDHYDALEISAIAEMNKRYISFYEKHHEGDPNPIFLGEIDFPKYADWAESISSKLKTASLKINALDLDTKKADRAPASNPMLSGLLTPDRIIYHCPSTTVIWKDKTKTTVKCTEGQPFSEYYGYLACLAKKLYGTNTDVGRMLDAHKEYGNGHDEKLKKWNPRKKCKHLNEKGGV